MISRHNDFCHRCYREIPKGSEVTYKRGRGIAHLLCPAVSTADLLAGRGRFEARQAARDTSPPVPDPYRRHDRANAAIYGGESYPTPVYTVPEREAIP
jgi:hypothetical protein